jgi:hypothetical protein
MGVLAQVENGGKIFENRNFMQPMTKLRVLNFFPFGFWGSRGGDSFVLCLFPSSSQIVPSVFLTTPQFLSHIVWLCFNFHV